MATTMANMVFAGLLTSFHLRCAEANAIFLGNRAGHLSGRASSGASSDLLHELEMLAGRDQRTATEQRTERLEAALRPMFDAMPKSSSGHLSFDGVRYVLHRLFVQRHGWFVNGLDTAGDAWDSISPSEILKQHSNNSVHELFAGKMSKHGLDLHHVAVLAATFEGLVHSDSVDRLRAAYRLLGHEQSDASLGEEETSKVIRAYMIMYVQGVPHALITPEEYSDASNGILEVYPTWPDTEIFVREVRAAVLADVVGSARTTWNNTLKVLEAIGERYGRWQNKECHVLKKTLVAIEQPGTGRVPLDKFYAGGVDNEDWMFLESVPYLEQLGALDKSDPQHLSVIIPNYVNSPSNCVASSEFYSVCCVDECDGLLATLESRIAAPEASPALIVQLISGLQSDTVKAPRNLPASLTDRLQEIATHHGGQVPLHGRLFAQWMHHAYPLECVYPHLSGTTKPVTAEKYTEHHGVDTLVSKDEMISIIKDFKTSNVSSNAELPWSTDEELFVYRQSTAHSTLGSWISRIFVLLAAVSSISLLCRRAFGDGGAKGCGSSKDLFV